eukprot:scaffold6213_cov112-Isochrysis_galbana.AAC.1
MLRRGGGCGGAAHLEQATVRLRILQLQRLDSAVVVQEAGQLSLVGLHKQLGRLVRAQQQVEQCGLAGRVVVQAGGALRSQQSRARRRGRACGGSTRRCAQAPYRPVGATRPLCRLRRGDPGSGKGGEEGAVGGKAGGASEGARGSSRKGLVTRGVPSIRDCSTSISSSSSISGSRGRFFGSPAPSGDLLLAATGSASTAGGGSAASRRSRSGCEGLNEAETKAASTGPVTAGEERPAPRRTAMSRSAAVANRASRTATNRSTADAMSLQSAR